MKQLDDHIFDAITKLQSKRQRIEDSMYNHILKMIESLTARKLEEHLNNLIKANKLKNKLRSRKNSYVIVENEEITFPAETLLPIDNLF